MRGVASLVAALVLILPVPASAQPVDDLQAADAVVQSVGWRLASANARYCDRVVSSPGLLLQDARTFTDPAAAREAYGLKGDIAVAAVAAGGPAARAGLDANATVMAIAGQPVSALPVPKTGAWDRQLALQGLLEQSAARTGNVALALADGRTVTIAGERACDVRFILDDSRGNAGATRHTVRVGRSLYNKVMGDEPLIAAMIAHELAHAALEHQTRIEASHHALGVVRASEREADRLSVWILAVAGYDPQAAVRMMTRIGPGFQFLFASPTHGGWRGRVRDMQAEIAVLRAAPDFDWKRRFRHEL